LPNNQAVQPEPGDSAWAELRDAQLQALQVPQTGLVTTIDLGEADNIHPKNKTDVGKRLALSALGTVYQKSIEYMGPLFDHLSKKNGKLVLYFNHTGGGLIAKGGKPLKGFAVTGEDGKFYWSKAAISGKTVVLKCIQVQNPIKVRYAWADNPICNLYNKEGLPASPFQANVTDARNN